MPPIFDEESFGVGVGKDKTSQDRINIAKSEVSGAGTTVDDTLGTDTYVDPTTTGTTTYTISFNNALYNPHSGHNASAGGILTSSGFKINGDTTNEYFLDEDGEGNVRLYYLVSGVRTYSNSTQGTINYTTGQIILNSLYITEVSNVDGATSTTVRLTVIPNSIDIKPVRNQVIEIDETNTSTTVTADDFDTTSGIGYTTPTSYA